MLRRLSTALVLMLCALAATAGVNQFTYTSPATGNVFGLAVDPTTAGEVYVTIFTGGGTASLYRSTNFGETWTPINDGFTPGMCSNDLHASPDGVIYSVCGGAVPVHKTNATGTAWIPASTGLPFLGCVSSLAVDPANPLVAVTGSCLDSNPGLIYRTVNAGDSWTAANTAAVPNLIVWIFAFGPSNVAYAAGQSTMAGTANAAKSTDGGQTWIALPFIGTSGSTVVFGLAVDPANANRVFAATSTGIYRSTDGGTSFQPVFSNPMSDIVIDPANPQIIYGSTQTTGVVKTINGGDNWSFVNMGLTDLVLTDIEIDVQDPNYVYTGIADGFVVMEQVPPVVTSIVPSSGPTAGGTFVTITGQNFVTLPPRTNVFFDGLEADDVTVTSTTQLTLETPPHAAGPVDVVVMNPTLQSITIPAGFTYLGAPAVTLSLEPATAGVSAGGTRLMTVTISAAQGSNTTVTLASNNTAAATVPPNVVITAGQTSATFNVTGVAAGNATITATLPIGLGAGSDTSLITVTAAAEAAAIPTAAETGLAILAMALAAAAVLMLRSGTM